MLTSCYILTALTESDEQIIPALIARIQKNTLSTAGLIFCEKPVAVGKRHFEPEVYFERSNRRVYSDYREQFSGYLHIVKEKPACA